MSLMVQKTLPFSPRIFLQSLQNETIDPLLETLVVVRSFGFGISRWWRFFRRFGTLPRRFANFKGHFAFVGIQAAGLWRRGTRRRLR